MKAFLICIVLSISSIFRVQAQSFEVQQLLLNVEKLAQFKQILADMKRGYEIINGGYNTVKNLSEGNFNIHKTFLDGLLAVSPTVKNYKRVPVIISVQIDLVKEYKSASKRFKQSDTFNEKELDYISMVYSRLFDQSLDNLEDLTTVLTANQLRMSDDERLQEIDRIYLEMQDKLQFLRYFNNQTSLLSLQRNKEKRDIESIRKSYGIQD